MPQYDVARVLYEADSGLTVRELQRRLDVTGGTIRENLTYLKKKRIVIQDGEIYQISPDKNESDIENLKPKTLDDLL